jgi:hypothetical protein
MKKTDLNRRDFNRLTMAAFGGIVAGTAIGCGQGGEEPAPKTGGEPAEPPDTAAEEPAGEPAMAANDWTEDIHVCRGLNACNGKGAGGENACAGQGSCATAEAHSCHGSNACKYQGGCGDSVGQNACNGKGECGVPLGDDAWAKARAAFETAMQKASKDFGKAPAKG